MYFSNSDLLLVASGVVFSFLSLMIFIRPHNIMTERLTTWLLNTRGRRSEDSQTPPRSMTPDKKSPASMNHKEAFPPSTRENLAKGATAMSNAKKLKGGPIDDVEFRKNQIPFTANYKECGPSTYTPMGLSMGEVEALGDFPNYAELSEVPLPKPYEHFEIDKAIPRPYRPFRWAYHQTMSLSNLEPDWWLELEKTYVERIAERKGLYQKYSKLVLQYLPGSELECKEIMEMALQFLCARYPQHFSLVHDDRKGWVFKNGLLKNETVIRDMHPLHVLLENVPEDFAVMIRNPEDGLYYFRAGLLCSSLGWNVDTKIGKQLREIHQPIPDYKEKMALSMDRFFSKFSPSKPIQRGSWGLEIDTPLFMPPGDPHEAYRDYQLPDLTLSRVHLRVDWQTLRRLPISGAIIFNFKALFTPIEEFRTESYVPKLVLKVLREGKKSLMEYKNTWHVEHVALPALERWAEEQEREGLVEEGWEERTLDESPYFPGWEEKWHRQQGF